MGQRIVATFCLLLGASCGQVPMGVENHTHQPVFYGQITPTLYPQLSQESQNAVVALCQHNTDYCFCSGTLIAPRVVLSAAHCIDSVHLPLEVAEIRVHIGNDAAAPQETLEIEEQVSLDWTRHPEDDMGLLVLRRPSQLAAPIALHQGQGLLGQQAQAVGFGMTDLCPRNTTRYWTSMQVTAVTPNSLVAHGNGRTGLAPGDSGGPLLYNFGDAIGVVGVAATAEPGWVTKARYTPVENHLDWLGQELDRIDPSRCHSICDSSCGQHHGCDCGDCALELECRGNRCLPAEPCENCNQESCSHGPCDGQAPSEVNCKSSPGGSALWFAAILLLRRRSR